MLPCAPAGRIPAGPWLSIPSTTPESNTLSYISGKLALHPEHWGATSDRFAPVADTQMSGAGMSVPLMFR